MKKLFIILKATSGVALISPTVLSITQDFNNRDSNDSSATTEKVVTADSNFMNDNLLNRSSVPLENFNDFKSSSTKTIENDDAFETRDENGAPYVRLGGGLFLDNTHYNAPIQSKYPGKLFGTSNYVADQPVDPANTFGLQHKMSNNYKNKGDIPAFSDITKPTPLPILDPTSASSVIEEFKQNQNFDFNQTKDHTISTNDGIVNPNDFNLTPKYIPGTEKIDPDNGKIINSGKVSQVKSFFTKLFNTDLFNWYWGTKGGWGEQVAQEGGESELANNNISEAQQSIQDLRDSYIDDAARLDLSTSYNQLVSKEVSDPWYAKLGEGVAGEIAGKVFDEAFKKIPILGWIADIGLDFLMPDTYSDSESIQQLVKYYSPSLNQGFWDNFFNTYLGTPDGSGGLINQYEVKYHQLPTQLNLKNFDIYSLFNTMDIHSQFQYDNSELIPPNLGISGKSNSTIGLNNLGINLGADIELSRNDADIDKALNEINEGLNSNPIAFGKEGLQPPYTAENSYNSEVIKGYIEGLYPSYTNIISDLTFSGDLKAGTLDKPYTNTINVYYEGDYVFTIPIEVASL